MRQRYSATNCDASDLAPGDSIAWEGRALPVVAIYPIEPVDRRETDGAPTGAPGERAPVRIHLNDGTSRGLHLRVGFRPSWSRTVERLKPHHQVCADCGLLWPCSDELIDREVAAAAHDLERTCTACGKTGGSMQMMGGEHLDIPGQMGAWFHGRTKRRAKCADAADAYRVRWLAHHQVLRAAEQAVEGHL